MKRLALLITIILLILINTGSVYGQNFKKKNAIYAELLGTSGSAFNFNYDRVILEFDKMYFDVTTGFGYFPSVNNSNPIIGVPISINLTTGTNNHHFEFGIGITYNSGILQEIIYTPSYSESNSFKAIYSNFRIGYKYQKPESGLFLRIGLTPLVRLKTIEELDNIKTGRFIPLFGLGAGYSL